MRAASLATGSRLIAFLVLCAVTAAPAQTPGQPAAATAPTVGVSLIAPGKDGSFNVGETLRWTATATDRSATTVPYTLMRNGLTPYPAGPMPSGR